MVKKIQTINIKTLGCRLNRAESDSIEELLRRNDYRIVPFGKKAGLTIINSCTVTNQAASKTRSAITKARKISPQGKIAVIGCYAQEIGAKILALEGVDAVIGNVRKYDVLNYIRLLEQGQTVRDITDIKKVDWKESQDSTFFTGSVISRSRRTRANLKIQEGCNYFCSYCIIPHLRGTPRSREIESCISEAQKLQKNEYKEIVLTGINIGTYNSRGYDLAGLIKKLLQETDLQRIRISSIEPDLVDDKLIDLIQNENRVCSHLHIPLQHGANKILEKMDRHYTIEEYSNLIYKIEQAIPGICIGTDIMTGFPGEEQRDFREMLHNLEALPVVHYHVFRYSPKEGTKAYQMENRVDPPVVKERARKLRKLGEQKKHDFVANFQGEILTVLAEKINDGGILSGYSDNFIRVQFSGRPKDVNRILPVRISSVEGNVSRGEVLRE